jgi:hypothetical protein
LDLSGTQLTEIKSDAFASLSRVTSLKLDNVLLNTLNTNSFTGLSALSVGCVAPPSLGDDAAGHMPPDDSSQAYSPRHHPESCTAT